MLARDASEGSLFGTETRTRAGLRLASPKRRASRLWRRRAGRPRVGLARRRVGRLRPRGAGGFGLLGSVVSRGVRNEGEGAAVRERGPAVLFSRGSGADARGACGAGGGSGDYSHRANPHEPGNRNFHWGVRGKRRCGGGRTGGDARFAGVDAAEPAPRRVDASGGVGCGGRYARRRVVRGRLPLPFLWAAQGGGRRRQLRRSFQLVAVVGLAVWTAAAFGGWVWLGVMENERSSDEVCYDA